MNDWYCDEAISGRTALTFILDTPTVLAHYHTRPAYRIHIVVYPRKHIASLTDVDLDDEPIVSEVISVVRALAVLVESEHGAARIITNLGAYQESKHLHFHVVSGDRL